MHIATQLTSQLQQISQSFIQSSFYDPTTLYLDDNVFDRDAFKQLKKQGLIEVSFEDNNERRYTLSSKGKEYINRA
jgi:hypothetical protein